MLTAGHLPLSFPIDENEIVHSPTRRNNSRDNRFNTWPIKSADGLIKKTKRCAPA